MVVLEPHGQAEVAKAGLGEVVGRGEEDVVGLDVAVHDVARVDVGEPAHEGAEALRGVARAEDPRVLHEVVLKGAPVHAIHQEAHVLGAPVHKHILMVDDTRVVQPEGKPGLRDHLLELLLVATLQVDHLRRKGAPSGLLARAQHDREPPRPELAPQGELLLERAGVAGEGGAEDVGGLRAGGAAAGLVERVLARGRERVHGPLTAV
mmetsp:Transcript_26655/g.85530  ORF Transcript_26655/g.85530 Transcript_26655/m.85530 type:complete len:207 (-) Transcript_26655:801-1421(-)